VSTLSAREKQVLELVAEGRTNTEIADVLGLAGGTIKSHLGRIGHKLGTGDRAAMVTTALRTGLIT